MENGKLNKQKTWVSAEACVPNHEQMVEIATWIEDNNPPFWKIDHAWYCKRLGEWVTTHTWYETPIQFWRDTCVEDTEW